MLRSAATYNETVALFVSGPAAVAFAAPTNTAQPAAAAKKNRRRAFRESGWLASTVFLRSM